MQPRQFCFTLFCCYFLYAIFILLLDTLTLKWSETQAAFSSTFPVFGGGVRGYKNRERGEKVRRKEGKKEVGKCGG